MMILPMFLPSGGGGGFDKPKWRRVAVVGVVWAIAVVVLYFTYTERDPFVHANFVQAQHPLWVLVAVICVIPPFFALLGGFVALMSWVFD